MVFRSWWQNGDTIYTKPTKSLGTVCLFCVKSNAQQRTWISKWKLAFKSVGVNWFCCPFSFKGPQLEPVRLVMMISIVCHPSTPPPPENSIMWEPPKGRELDEWMVLAARECVMAGVFYWQPASLYTQNHQQMSCLVSVVSLLSAFC